MANQVQVITTRREWEMASVRAMTQCYEMSERQKRLFMIACCRSMWDILDEDCRTAVEVAEKFADGQIKQFKMDKARFNAQHSIKAAGGTRIRLNCAAHCVVIASLEADKSSFFYPNGFVEYFSHTTETQPLPGQFPFNYDPVVEKEQKAKRELAANIYREVINPFHETDNLSAFSNKTVENVAIAIYNEKRFEDLPILADALEDAGCVDAELLGHFRQPGYHCRGCWALDIVLGYK